MDHIPYQRQRLPQNAGHLLTILHHGRGGRILSMILVKSADDILDVVLYEQ